MYLKQLEIIGFKSFANKTTVSFSNGITAIVGPNGCGKTNILDSLRWVLGEQRVSLLRGSKMEEVIFNGSKDIPPLGMSEVTLTVVNDRGVLPTEYNELQITRRLFRSGESEYLLNKVPCRLKDIAELFYDTGMGAHSYSVIQQDMIEAVISDKAEERRFLFEEAAGITKYKQRKRAALRKLEATEQDFLRLNDIYTEVKSQVESLRRQQKKAEKYQSIATDVKAWDLYLNASRVQNCETERRKLMAERDEFQNQVAHHDAILAGLSAEVETLRTSQLEIETDLSKASARVYELSESAHASERELSVLNEKRGNAVSLIEKNRNEITGLSARQETIQEGQKQVEEELTQHRQSFEQITGEVTQAEQAQAAADKALFTARAGKDQENKKLIELEGRLSSGKTEEESLREQEQEFTKQSEVLNTEINSRQTQLQQTLARYEALLAQLEEFKTTKRTQEEKHTALNTEIESLIESGETSSDEIASLTASLEAAQARRSLLADMILHYEGYGSGVQAVMESRSQWPGISGTVAEKFVPVEGMEAALEAALGDWSGYVICKDRSTAESVINWVRSEKKGKLGTLLPDTGTLNPVVKRPELSIPEFVGWLDSFVSTDDSLRMLMQATLSRIAVFKAGTSPDELLTRLPYGFSAVSTDGILYSKNVVTGGSTDSFPLFRRQEKVEEQDKIITTINTQLETAKENKNRLTARLAAARAEWQAMAGQLEESTEKIQDLQGQSSESEYQKRTLETDIDRLTKEKQQATERVEKIRHRQYTLGLDFGTLSNQKQELEGEIYRSHEHLEDLERQATAALERVAKLQMASLEARNRIEQAESKMRHQEEIINDLRATIAQKQQEIATAEQDITGFDQQSASLETSLKSLFTERASAIEGQTALQAKQGEMQKQTSAAEAKVRESRSSRDSITSESHRLELKLTAMDSELNTVIARMQEEYDVDITNIVALCPDQNIPENEAREHLARQKESLKRFGAVNLLALEEFQAASEREKFLNEQLTDLKSAKADLQETIAKINTTAKQMFVETFEKVKTNFKNLFVELFTGGEADITLEDPNNPLESNIDIIARPRGKKILSITMMSGGERALTAISLLFSLYLVKPSPFCILDEIDAPLDDANCNRFLKIIRTFSKQTQFITITHNKITMAAADNLYGVTMEQPGISKLVGVRFGADQAGQRDTVRIQKEEPAAETFAQESDTDAVAVADSDDGIDS